jgi:hypothetical protein
MPSNKNYGQNKGPAYMAGLSAYRKNASNAPAIRLNFDLSQFIGLGEALKKVPYAVQKRIIAQILKKQGKPLLARVKQAVPISDVPMAIVTRNGKRYASIPSGNLRASYTLGIVHVGGKSILWIGPNLSMSMGEDKIPTSAVGWYAAFVLYGAARFGKGYIVPANNYLRFVSNPTFVATFQNQANEDVLKYYKYLLDKGISSTKKKVRTVTKIAV